MLRIQCRYCKVARNYLPDDLRHVLGDIEVDDVTDAMRCQKCGQKHTLITEAVFPGAAERQGMTIRKLEKVYYVKRVIWRDEPA
ncbi:hypothetical protein ASD64_08835 [Mesorhizobium sp. Root157]|uniref:hypothetical protein n=1 Tax=Mesorhizobium sp. Root157 TaxID=1736477 RepID=UPI0006F55B3D|nr:hypothetical protein [Mesorhizobium sp. Root157]KQZ81855.1 hypothetical protein ASD64_08835 [Mesorhizobium sp. Root157]